MKDVTEVMKENSFEGKPKEMNPMVLAYIGDAVYELFVRMLVIKTEAAKVNTLHKLSVNFVKATSQAKALRGIEEMLTEEESGVVRRAKNHKNQSFPRNVSIKEYKLATAFEALLGFLYLSDKRSRLEELMKKSIEILGIGDDRQEVFK